MASIPPEIIRGMEFTLFAQIHLKLEVKFGDPLLQVNTAEKYHLQKRQIASSQRKINVFFRLRPLQWTFKNPECF